MPQIIAVALVGGLLWYGYRVFKREMERVGRETRDAEKAVTKHTALEKGEDGVYRPVERDSDS